MKRALLVAAAILLASDTAHAQNRGRIVLTPAVDLLLPDSYYARKFQGERSRSDFRVRQEPLALIGGQLSYELPGTSWRAGVGYARGESDLRVYYFYHQGDQSPTEGLPSSSMSFEMRYAEPATREILTIAAARQLVRGPASIDLSSALVHQWLDAVFYRGFLQTRRIEERYTAWGMQLGTSVGAARGWARSLRIGAQAQALRTPPELYKDILGSPNAPADAGLEIGLAASIGWRMSF